MAFSDELIAPCGINCGVCIAYLRDTDKCYGCLSNDNIKSTRSIKCGIKFCNEHKKKTFTYCFECEKFPCSRLKSHDKRYLQKYRLSTIDNLTYIMQYRLDAFLKKEDEKWSCRSCGKVLSVHQSFCLNCKTEYR